MNSNLTHRAIREEFRAARILCKRGATTVASAVTTTTFSVAPLPTTAVSVTTTADLKRTVSSSAFRQHTSSPAQSLPPTSSTHSTQLYSDPMFAGTQSRDAADIDGGDKLPRSTPSARKARAQVAPPVAHSVLQGACELKLDRKRGRKVEQAEAKSEILGVRFQSGELAIIRCKAQMVGVPTNSFIRASALGSDYRPPRNPELVKALIALNKELTAQGNNINQIARQVNGGTTSPAEADGMLGIIARTHIQTHKAIRAALSHGKEPAP